MPCFRPSRASEAGNALGTVFPLQARLFLLVHQFGAMLIVAVAVCMFSMLGGAYLSFFIDSAPAPTTILILTAIFIAAFVNRLAQTRRQSGKVAGGEAQKTA